jgi:hypothetical protein
MSPGLQLGDGGGLVGWERPGDDVLNADSRRDGPGGGLAVAGQQHGVQPEPAQSRDGAGRRRLDRVGDRDGAADLTVPPGHHGDAAGFLPGPAPRGQAGRSGQAVPGEQRLAADDDRMAVDGPARPHPDRPG